MPPDTPGSDAGPSIDGLAEDALDNLVHQFARPLDFLRELVQNAIDAGTPRIEVEVAHDDPEEPGGLGVTTVRLRDWGEGMDEAIIDTQLTRMFSSTKEDDLTKIGKFGIGFTSIFAIRPDAVLLRTGRHGESWELLFHADRSFDKVRLEEPVTGTSITLYKRMPRAEVAAFVAEARWVLGYWCEHSSVPVSFLDATGLEATEPEGAVAPDPDDPFAAFAAPEVAVGPAPEAMARPFALDGCDLSTRLEKDGVLAVVGMPSEAPTYGFYNGGLTLVSTRDRECLGDLEGRLGHLSVKVKYDRLEHTLTRDNVLRDVHWQKAMRVVSEAADELAARLFDRLERAVEAHEALGPWHQHLAHEVRAGDLVRRTLDFGRRCAFVDRRGHRLDLDAVEAQENEVDAVLMAPGSTALCEALEAQGLRLLPPHPGTLDLLHATWRKPWLSFQSERAVLPADQVFLLPEFVERAHLPAHQRALLQLADAMLADTFGRRLTVRLGRFSEHASDGLPLALEGPDDSEVFQIPSKSWFRLPVSLRRRCLLINAQHPSWRAHAAAAREQPVLGAFGLLQAMLVEEGVEDPDHIAKLALHAAELLSQTEPRGSGREHRQARLEDARARREGSHE